MLGVIFVDIGGIVDHHPMSWCERWFLLILVELLTSLNELRHINSLGDGQQFHQYQQKSPLTSTHWVMVNNSTNINKNHLSPNHIEWWSTIPPISTKITSHLNSLSDGQQFHQYQQKSPLTSTHWVMVNIIQCIEVRGDFCWYWWNCWPSLNELKWEGIFVDIGGIVDHHSMSWSERCSHLNSLSDGQQFHQYQQKSPLTSIHWASLNELKWEVIFVDIGGMVDHHAMS
jgi:predicted secreted protein